MLEEQKNNPLHGVKLEALLTELVEFYGFDILAEQININCFKSNPSIKSSLKFLRKTPWARNKLEAFYLYKFKQLPLPTEADHALEPGERPISLDQKPGKPAEIKPGDPEFFDDPNSGPAYPDKQRVLATRSKSKLAENTRRGSTQSDHNHTAGSNKSEGDGVRAGTGEKVDPWAKWREKNDQEN